MSNATVCLNMIVKNEAHLIRQTLEMLCSKIRFDYWVICDTGSTDATREIIQDFFGNRVHIPGELHCDEWVNFGHNRTKALTYAHNKTDLLLVFDADDAIYGTIQLPTAVTHDEYHLKFGAPNTGDSTYTRTQLINNRKRFRYYSVLHEYISCLEPSPDEGRRICILEGDYYVVSGRSGARNRDPDKYLKDALLLEAAHAEALVAGDDLHMRYAFYCANSYRDCGRYEDAIRWYKTTLSQDNWVQEKYLSCIYAHDCYAALGQKEHGFFYLVKSLSYDLERAEGVYALIQHYCSCSTPPASDNVNFQIAYNYYRIVQSHYERAQLEVEPQFKLFVQPDKANFFLPYYMIIVADRVGDRACGIRMYEIIFRKKQRMVGQWYLRNLFYNVRCFVEHIRKDTLGVFAALANDYLRFLRENGVPLSIFDEVASTYDYGAYGIELSSQPLLQPLLKPQPLTACRSSRAILFYTGYSSVPWNYSGMTRGALGGSEKAVAYLSLELLKLGYTVYVSGDVQPEEIALANTQCSLKYVALPDLPELLRTTAFHTIVCSRYVSFLELYGATASWYQFYIWAHDTHLLPYGCALSDTAIVEKWSARIDGCVCQTRWHADEYARKYPALQSKIRVINNGIDAALFPAIGSLGSLGKKVRNRFIYTSRTERGLSRILELWPDILKMMPDATLVISTYVAFPCNDDERRIQARIAELNQIHPGQKEEQEHCIRHLGQLNHEKLYAEMGAAEYWLYPTDWPETSCITAMEMLMSGVICLYYPVAGLTDTMGGCGIQVAPGSELETLCRITSDETQKAKQREQGRAYAEGCTWTHRAQQWVQTLTLNPSNTLQTLTTNEYKTMIINLKRRRDRRLNIETQFKNQKFVDYEFMDAVDGSQLLPTAYIQRLFHGNNFNYRKGVIGCAMSHLALWKRLMHDTSCDVYVVMEDDAELVDDFEVKLEKAIRLFMSEPRAELCFISGFSITDPCTSASNLQLIKKDNNHDMGNGGYLIKKSGAVRFVDYYNTHSIKVAIDAAIIIDFNEHLYKMNQYLIKSPFFGPDTDIQQSYDEISFSQMNSNYITVAFCDWWEIEYGGGTFNLHDNFFVNLLKTHCGFEIKPVDPSQNPDILFYSVFGQSNGAYRAGRKVFYAGEPVSHRADADFNITFDASNAINTRLPLWVCYFDHAILSPRQIPKREKFCSYIATNPRANRETFVAQLSSQYKRVDCGGKHLNNIGGAIPPGTNASGKIEHNKQYKFAIAFENTQYPGYVTEKICDVYKSGCIPIYWGTPDVTQDFNPTTFINANDFPNFDALIDHIRRVDCDDELYASYFKDPVLSDAWMQIFADPIHAFFKQIASDILHI